ncbi:MAG: hypothetical protein H6736_21725 [Alphaproteobacteria bacterium]|nr:hypothetical protein [Alphaproteobacteria bacterium]
MSADIGQTLVWNLSTVDGQVLRLTGLTGDVTRYGVRIADAAGRVLLEQLTLVGLPDLPVTGGSVRLELVPALQGVGSVRFQVDDVGPAATVSLDGALTLDGGPLAVSVPFAGSARYSLSLLSATSVAFESFTPDAGISWRVIDLHGQPVFGPETVGVPLAPLDLPVGAWVLG